MLTFVSKACRSASSLGWLTEVSTRQRMALRLAQTCSSVSTANDSQAARCEPVQSRVRSMPITMPRAVTAVSCRGSQGGACTITGSNESLL